MTPNLKEVCSMIVYDQMHTMVQKGLSVIQEG